MKIELKEMRIGDVCQGYVDNDEEGVYGLDGKLNIRPKYQREFVYDDKKRDAVLDTIRKKYPLNVMYWVNNSDGTFEVLDGQQRTISFCQYINGDFSIDEIYFWNLTEEEQKEILDYKLMVYVCDGNDRERLEWFKTINIAGEKLTDQELLNVNYTGAWLTDAKKRFSKTNCVAYRLAKDYVKGSPIRQEFLETALKWISNGKVASYMSEHQNDANSNELWLYFNSVIEWVKALFPKYRKEMKSVQWGELYNKYKDNQYDATEMEAEISRLMADDDVTSKKGVYEYLLSGKTNEKVLSIRTFTESQKRGAYERQGGICPICGQHHELEDMQGDHIVEWSKGGKTIPENLQMVCHNCHKKLTKTMTD